MGCFDGIRERNWKKFQSDVLSALTSDEKGRDAIVSFIETREERAAVLSAFARDEVDAAVHDIFARCRADLLEEFARLRADLLAEAMKVVDEARTRFQDIMQSEKQRVIGGLTDEAEKLLANYVERLHFCAREIEEALGARLSNAVNERLQQHGEILVSEAVATYVRSRPVIYHGASNRETAANLGVSIREVKRMRRVDQGREAKRRGRGHRL